MNLKKINTILLFIVGLLLIIAILTLLRCFFFDAKNTEWGSISDWLSSLSSLFTCIIAGLAYNSASKWFRQKKNDEGFSHVSGLLKDYDLIILNLRDIYFKVFTVTGSEESINELNLEFDEHVSHFFVLENKIKACTRWKIIVPNEALENIRNIKEFYSTARKFVLSHRFSNRNEDNLNKRLEFQEELTEKYHTILNNNSYFLRDIEDIFRFPK